MSKKVNLFLIGLVTLVTLSVGFSSCSKDNDEGGGSGGGETLNVNGRNVGGKLTVGAMYYLHNNWLQFHVISYTEDIMFHVKCQDWNWDNITIGTDLISLYRKKEQFSDGYWYPNFDISYTGPENDSYLGDHSKIKGGQIILKSKDLSQKQFKVQVKDLILGYHNEVPGGDNYPGFVKPADITINGEFLFTYEEIR